MTDTDTATPEGAVSEKIAAEIEAGIDQLAASEDEKTEEKETEEKTPVEDKPEETTPKEGEEAPADQGDEKKESDQEQQGEESPGEPEGEEEPSEAEARTDELLTRAVRAGMSIKNARTIVSQDADALEEQVQLLEKLSQPDAKAGEGDEDATPEEDPLTGIPELDPEVYDENIVAVVEGMKSIIRKQGETIKGLSTSGEKSWFNKQADSLKVKNLDSAKRTELNEQFDVLKAGYAVKGQKVEDDAVFQQATKLVLGDEIKAMAEAQKGAKLKKRASLQTVRPGGPAAKPKGDVLDEIAKDVDGKFFK
jgi:hypothetical protein